MSNYTIILILNKNYLNRKKEVISMSLGVGEHLRFGKLENNKIKSEMGVGRGKWLVGLTFIKQNQI